MDALNFLQVYNSYIKYIYYLVVAIIVVILIVLLKKVIELFQSLQFIGEHGENIVNTLTSTQEKTEVINHTCSTSIPYFTKIFLIFSILNETTKDFFNTKTSKRNLRKSFKKVCKIQKKIDPSFSFAKVIESIVNR